MDYKNRVSTYEKFPTVKISSDENGFFDGYDAITGEFKSKNKQTLVIDCYPGVDYQELLTALTGRMEFAETICSDEIFYDKDTLNSMMQAHLTDDRVRGVMYYGKITDFIDSKKLEIYRNKVKGVKGNILVYGFGASLITEGDTLVYADLARWEIQMRYRKGLPNFKQDNYNEDVLKKYKRGYFIEWRIADKHKRGLFDKADYWLDTNKSNNPKMVSGETFRDALKKSTRRPFRVVPYFDPGVWGGQWMKTVCGLDMKEKNFAWSFDGVPEENSLLLQFGSKVMEIPSINAVLYDPIPLLGENVYARFGAEFPIRFDFLDTFEGQNLSLQVHPTMDFIKHEYGMSFTQEESYYMLDAAEGAKVYLGLKNGADRNSFFNDLERANKGECGFNAEKYVNVIDTKAHDHFLIPPGTIHCSAKDCMVLEISTSAYIFTFKLWDWDRVGLDGLPRPIHLEEGKQVLNFNYNTDFTMNELVNRFEILSKDDHLLVEKTGLHKLQFLETIRYTFDVETVFDDKNSVQMLNLVEGEEIEVSSTDGSFDPMIVHYAETFIIPASVKQYLMKPVGKSEGKSVKVLQAYMKSFK